jgi:dTDP-4-amino-4,6-dideoxy-D-galactose acyltransferase
MKAAERKAFLQGAKSLSVSTQEINIPASKLYKSLGYELIDRIFVYHYWNG